MMETIVITMVIWFALVALITFIWFSDDSGTKGIEKEPYYGRKTGTIYTASKDRERHIV